MKNMLISKALAVKTEIQLPGVGGDKTSIDYSSIMKFIDDVIVIAFDLAIVVGVIMILYSSFLYASSFGDDAKAETAKKTLLWSIIGTIVVFIARTIQGSLQNLVKGTP